MWMFRVMKTTWLTAQGRSIGSGWLSAGGSLSPSLCNTATHCLPNITWSCSCTSVGTDHLKHVLCSATHQVYLPLFSHSSASNKIFILFVPTKMNLYPLLQAGEMRWKSRFRSHVEPLASGGFTSIQRRTKQFSLCAVQQTLSLANTIWSC